MDVAVGYVAEHANPVGSDGNFWLGGAISVYGEGMAGLGHGMGSVFPSSAGLTGSASSFALEMGGGVDVGLSTRFVARVIQAGWLRTQLPNSTTKVQTSLTVGAGMVVKF